MAELAIPLLALGGMYVISNQKKTDPKPKQDKNNYPGEQGTSQTGKESFDNLRQNQYLPNTHLAATNFPTLSQNRPFDNMQEYSNPNTATDKYFNQTEYENKQNKGVRVGDTMQSIYSMTGNYLDSKEFKHNNMVPFYGGKIKGYTYDTQISESVLDNMAGTGSQVIKKIEQAPLFQPEDNVQWTFGAPNSSDFYQSRVNPGMKNNNTKPFDSEYVAPGLNQGYTTHGSGGFNSGMESRDNWLPKTVDELRVATNPKTEYSLDNLEGPSYATIKNVGLIGRVEKQRPDTFFIQEQDRWLTTTGAEKGETLRPIQEMGIIRRAECDIEYTGPAGAGERKATYVPPAVEAPKRAVWQTYDVSHSCAVGKGPHHDGDNLLQSFTNYNNHRSTTIQPDTMRSGFSRAIGAAIAPIMDILKPSRKEEVVSNARIYGCGGDGTTMQYVYNPNDATQTTIKQTTMYSPQFNISGQNREYVDNNTALHPTQRETTDCSYLGNAGGPGAQYGDMNYDAAYMQNNNDIKSQTIYNRTNLGNAKIMNTTMNICVSKNDADCFNYRVGAPHSVFNRPPAKENYGAIRSPQQYDESFNCERIDPGLLDAFRSNPYTHTLTNSV